MDKEPNGFIHIGPVKTGTTYIQKTFVQNAAVFERFGIYYPHAPVQMNAPRFANAAFLWDASREPAMEQQLHAGRTFLISEEALFFQPWLLRHAAFGQLHTRIIFYIRRPAELIPSWAAEYARPYNVVVKSLPDVNGPLAIEAAIEILSRHCEQGIWRFIAYAAGARDDMDVIVRPFGSGSFSETDLLSDFLACLGLNAQAVRADPDFREVGLTNEGASRKLCDISYAAWLAWGRPTNLEHYNSLSVERINSLCRSGDPRPVIDTIGDEVLDKLTKRFAFFERFVSDRFLGGAPVFANSYPSIYGMSRAPYEVIDADEVATVIRGVDLA